MVNKNIKIVLLDTNGGVLDVADGTSFPLNFAVSDIRNPTVKTGVFSKTVTLADSKNNATLLGHLYDLNANQGFVFDINKKQRCSIVQNGVTILREGVFRLLSVTKVQNNLTKDDKVVYEAQVIDPTGDFFSIVSGRFLTDLEVPNDGHLYTPQDIVGSWSHTWSDVYKYIVPWTNLVNVPVKVMYPGIYAKWYFDKIHETAGYNYEWTDQSDRNVKFDKLIVPFNSDLKDVSKKYAEDNKITVQEVTPQEFPPVTIVQTRARYISYPTFVNSPFFNYSQIILNPNSEWSVVNGVGQMIPTKALYPPDYYKIETSYDIEVILRNQEASAVQLPGSIFNAQMNVISAAMSMLNTTNSTIAGFRYVTFTSGVTGISSVVPTGIHNGGLKLNSNIIFPPGDTLLGTAKETVEWSMGGFNPLSVIKGGFFPDTIDVSNSLRFLSSFGIPNNAKIIIRVNNIRSTIYPYIENGIPQGSQVDLNLFIPDKIKQSDFLKSICTMFNLYAEMDPDNQYRIIYKRRDKFYDEGKISDWRKKLNREKDQVINFLPNLTNKKLLLTYKYDSGDSASKSYNEKLKEVYGQLEFTFANQHVRDIDKQEIIFSPTINTQTFFGANMPRFTDDPFSPKTNIRILQDGGLLPCTSWTIEEYPTSPNNITNQTTYPFFGHFDNPTTPTYDINFGLPRYLLYQATSLTQNNLFWNNWARTMSNIETGNMLTAWFWLTEADMNLLRLSDKIQIESGYYYINKIIDYNAAAYQPTKVELISVEQATNLGISTASTIRPYNLKDAISAALPNWGAITSGNDLKDTKRAQLAGSRAVSENGSIIQDATNAIILGRNNTLTQGFAGVIIGDDKIANDPGFYVGDYRLTNQGMEFQGNLIIDGGYDEVMNMNKTNEVDFIDAGYESVRKWGGVSNARIFIDGGKI
jgi:hypothetical protein